jgi:membrane protease YdiL (CAAX protease family)
VYHFDPVFPEAATPQPAADAPPAEPLSRGRAAAEVFVCSGYPTQLLIASLLTGAGIQPMPEGRLSPTFVFANLAIDSLLSLTLVWMFLKHSGEDPLRVFFGGRPAGREIRIGLLSVPLVLCIVVAIQLAVAAVAPSLHNVRESPFVPLLDSRWLLAGFVALLVLAGGIREELQRAFVLHRFEQRLGGPAVGLLVTSLAFGLGHTMQGWDAAIATGVLGAFWGVIYVTRRSAAAPIVSHAFFNIIQVLAGYAVLSSS